MSWSTCIKWLLAATALAIATISAWRDEWAMAASFNSLGVLMYLAARDSEERDAQAARERDQTFQRTGAGDQAS